MLDEELRAFAQLQSADGWRVVRGFLEKRLKGYDESNRAGEGVRGEWMRGRSQELSDLLKLFENARGDLDKRVKKPNPSGRY